MEIVLRVFVQRPVAEVRRRYWTFPRNRAKYLVCYQDGRDGLPDWSAIPFLTVKEEREGNHKPILDLSAV